MKLNIGCGFRKMDGYINVDAFPDCHPDVLHDLEQTPWPFESDSVSEIVASHVLEHLGADKNVFFNVIKEIYRILTNGGLLQVAVPHYMHQNYYADPTHVRTFTKRTFEMLDMEKNRHWMAKGSNVTMLAAMLKVDFELVSATQTYDDPWTKKLMDGELTRAQLREIAGNQWNVVTEVGFTLRARKP
ncbi:class I SAM-dependent methyltransferase [Nisaea sp.]|uniref:class I SAM-dependent methyltransferase n=1 Tax=Nisaea sp. TaxID=2024842 RepID=UPI003B52F5C5